MVSLISALGQVDLCEFESILVYRASFRTTNQEQRNCLKITKPNLYSQCQWKIPDISTDLVLAFRGLNLAVLCVDSRLGNKCLHHLAPNQSFDLL